MVQRARLVFYPMSDHYWFPCRNLDLYDEQWQPAFWTRGVCITLDICFESREACEEFIDSRIYHASDHLGGARVKSYQGPWSGRELSARDEQWGSWVKPLI